MKGDFSRFTFNPERHYSAVRLQQGRVQLDADWNEQVDIQAHLGRTVGADIIGASGAPSRAAGFAITAAGDNLSISAGRYYVDGILVENERDVLFKPAGSRPAQPHGAIPSDWVPNATGAYVVFLDVWERHLTAVDVPALREVALGGPDTATRTQVIWQVRLMPSGALPEVPSAWEVPGPWKLFAGQAHGGMAARTQPIITTAGPCVVPASAGYRRLENQLYRVEIHDFGAAGTATFKWSRDNGIVATRLLGAPQQRVLTVADPGRDESLGFASGQWIEVIDDWRLLRGEPGVMVRVKGVVEDTIEIEAWPGTDPNTAPGFDLATTIVRRWDQSGMAAVLKVPAAGGAPMWVDLEGGVQISFDGSASYQVGDYWLIPARTISASGEGGGIGWPGDPLAPPYLPPQGVQHHVTRLAVVSWNGTAYTVRHDSRWLFPSLTEPELHYLSGDGQDAMPGDTVPQPLRVRVSNGDRPLQGAWVRFEISAEGTGGDAELLPQAGASVASRSPPTGAIKSFVVAADTNGEASCSWRLQSRASLGSAFTGMASELPRQQVRAMLLALPGDTAHLGRELLFGAAFDVAWELAYLPNAETLPTRPADTVQAALDELYAIKVNRAGDVMTGSLGINAELSVQSDVYLGYFDTRQPGSEPPDPAQIVTADGRTLIPKTPVTVVLNGGLTVGGDRDPGDNNLHVGGQCTVDGDLTVHGDLFVVHPPTSVDRKQVVVEDSIIRVNSYDPTGITSLPLDIDGGLEVYRGGADGKPIPVAQMLWDEGEDRWKAGLEGGLASVAYGTGAETVTDGRMADGAHKHSRLHASAIAAPSVQIMPDGTTAVEAALTVRGHLALGALGDNLVVNGDWEFELDGLVAVDQRADAAWKRVDVRDSPCGAAALEVRAFAAFVLGDLIPFDGDALYELEIVARQTGAPSNGTSHQIFYGAAGYDASGAPCNVDGKPIYEEQHFVAVSGQQLGTGWTRFVGFLQGHAPRGTPDAAPQPEAPGACHEDVRWIRPLVSVNHPGGDGRVQIASVRLRRRSTLVVAAVNIPTAPNALSDPANPAVNVQMALDELYPKASGAHKHNSLYVAGAATPTVQVAADGTTAVQSALSVRGRLALGALGDNLVFNGDWEYELDGLVQVQSPANAAWKTVPVTDSPCGARALQIDGYAAFVMGDAIPVDASVLYEFEIVARQARAPTDAVSFQIFCGAAGYDASGKLCNVAGQAGANSQHYVAVSGDRLPAGWTRYVGYLQGRAAQGAGLAAPRPEAPGALHQAVRAMRPIVYVNYPNGNGQVQIASVRVRRLPVTLGGSGMLLSTGPTTGAFLGHNLTPSTGQGVKAVSGGPAAGIQARGGTLSFHTADRTVDGLGEVDPLSPRIYVDSDGRVGIGTTRTEMGRLVVNGDLFVNGVIRQKGFMMNATLAQKDIDKGEIATVANSYVGGTSFYLPINSRVRISVAFIGISASDVNCDVRLHKAGDSAFRTVGTVTTSGLASGASFSELGSDLDAGLYALELWTGAQRSSAASFNTLSMIVTADSSSDMDTSDLSGFIF